MLDPDVLIERAIAGDRRALARLITLVEDRRPGGGDLLAELYRRGGGAWTVGVTGAPGAGKSSLVDRLIAHTRLSGAEIAVLAIDPSSPFSGGAVLGDRVRMQDHIGDSGVYIRSMATRGHLGGLSVATPQASAVLDGVGFPEIVIETVGVGQAEVAIASQTDTTVVVVNPGWGDSIQAAKAGLLEVGDVFVVNKADRAGVEQTVTDLKQMLQLGGERPWWPPIVTTVATEGRGIDELHGAIHDHRHHLKQDGRRDAEQRLRAAGAVRATVELELRKLVADQVDDAAWDSLIEDIIARRTDPWSAAQRLTDQLAQK